MADSRALPQEVWPPANTLGAPLDTSIVIRFHSVQHDESQFWGHMLGSALNPEPQWLVDGEYWIVGRG